MPQRLEGDDEEGGRIQNSLSDGLRHPLLEPRPEKRVLHGLERQRQVQAVNHESGQNEERRENQETGEEPDSLLPPPGHGGTEQERQAEGHDRKRVEGRADGPELPLGVPEVERVPGERDVEHADDQERRAEPTEKLPSKVRRRRKVRPAAPLVLADEYPR